ncbi:DevA family ABC transporter ATP-binding protein [Leptolyngbya sp. AN03gr2]|uniref:DevA family ABC transporter ATP-binding protein n=1 Tax=unclassified Leptolyngbya TaxID=2650499 RepID=UPI003D323E36
MTLDSMVANSSTVAASSVIRVEGLDHFFGAGELRKQVLFEINLSIDAGEIVILTGPSGSGKTTLLSLMGGLRSPQSGSLRMLETELVGATKAVAVEARRSCGYIFQAHNLHTSLTAQENVMMGLEVHGSYSRSERRGRALKMLEVVGLEQRTQYYPTDLSGGQKQRVAIARALVSHPRIVLADEPTAALDKKSGRDVVELMQKLAKEQGCTILMVTHDNRILDVADRIIYMEDGQLSNQPEPTDHSVHTD